MKVEKNPTLLLPPSNLLSLEQALEQVNLNRQILQNEIRLMGGALHLRLNPISPASPLCPQDTMLAYFPFLSIEVDSSFLRIS